MSLHRRNRRRSTGLAAAPSTPRHRSSLAAPQRRPLPDGATGGSLSQRRVARSAGEQADQAAQLGAWHHALNQGKQLALLAALELAPEFVKHLERRVFGRCDLASEIPHVLGENPGDERLIGIEKPAQAGSRISSSSRKCSPPFRVPVRQEAVASVPCG